MKYLIEKSILVYPDFKDILTNEITTDDISLVRLKLINKYRCNAVYFVFHEVPELPVETNIDIDKIISEALQIPVERIRSKDRCRKREEVEARQIAMWWRKNNTKKSLAAIGLIYGGRDHSTVLYAARTIKNLIETNREFRSKVDDILESINQENS